MGCIKDWPFIGAPQGAVMEKYKVRGESNSRGLERRDAAPRDSQVGAPIFSFLHLSPSSYATLFADLLIGESTKSFWSEPTSLIDSEM